MSIKGLNPTIMPSLTFQPLHTTLIQQGNMKTAIIFLACVAYTVASKSMIATNFKAGESLNREYNLSLSIKLYELIR